MFRFVSACIACIGTIQNSHLEFNNHQTFGLPDFRTFGLPDFRTFGLPDL